MAEANAADAAIKPLPPVMRQTKPLLLLGGTAQARGLCDELARAGYAVTYSLAGRTTEPLLPQNASKLRIGGFGGVSGLVAHLAQHNYAAIIDATHPFARTMSNNAVLACAQTNSPLLRLTRPQWQPEPSALHAHPQAWQEFSDQAALLTALSALSAKQVFLALGSVHVAAFFALSQHSFIVRSITPVAQDNARASAKITNLHARGPFTLAHELELLQSHNINLVIAKNSGDDQGYNKLRAAQQLGIPCWLIARPQLLPAQSFERNQDILAALARQ